jgi:hypothetical protein
MLYKPTNVQPGTIAPLAPTPYVEESDAGLNADELIDQNEDEQD